MNNITEKNCLRLRDIHQKSHQHGKTSKSNQKKYHQNGSYQEKLKKNSIKKRYNC